MSMNLVRRDITEARKGILAHGVHCGDAKANAGIARALRQQWPAAFHPVDAKPGSPLLLGRTLFVAIPGTDLVIAHCYTQLTYGRTPGRYANPHAIYTALRRVFQVANDTDQPVVMPKIGCGLGGLDWEDDVLPVVRELQEDFPNLDQVWVCYL